MFMLRTCSKVKVSKWDKMKGQGVATSSKSTRIENECNFPYSCLTHPWPFSKSKFNLKSDRVNLFAPASPIKCLLYLTNVLVIQHKLGPERLTRLENSNVLRLPVVWIYVLNVICLNTFHIYLWKELSF